MRTVGMMVYVVWLAVMLMGKSFSGEATEIADVAKAKEDYLKNTESLVITYTKILNSEKDKIFAKGDLELAKAVGSEIEGVSKIEPEASSVDWKKNATLKTAQKTFNDGLVSKKKAYIDALNKIVSDFVKKKDLESAEIVKKFVEEMTLEEVKRMFVGKWILENNCLQTFNSDMTVSHNTDKGVWCIENNSIIVKWNSGWKDIYTLPLTENMTITTERGSIKKKIVAKKES